MGKVTENSKTGEKKRGAKRVIVRLLREHLFGISILACAAIAFAFPSAFTEWGGVKLTSLVVPAIQVIMFGMGTTLSLADFLRVAKRPWAVATGLSGS